MASTDQSLRQQLLHHAGAEGTMAAKEFTDVLKQLSPKFFNDDEKKGQRILESVGVNDGRINLQALLSWLDITDDSQAVSKVVTEKGFVPYYTANVIPGVSFDSMAKVYSKFNNKFVAKATLRCIPVTDMAKLYSKFNDKFIAKGGNARAAACAVLQQASASGLLSAQLNKVFAKDIARGAACAVLQQANASGILSSELSKVFAKAAPGSQGEKYAFQPSVGSWLQCTPAQRRKHTPKEKARDAACAVLQQANASGILSAELSKIFVQVMPDILDKSPRTLMEVDSKTLIDSFRSEIAKRDAEIAALKASM